MGQKSHNPEGNPSTDFASDDDVLPAVPGQNNGAGNSLAAAKPGEVQQ